MDINIKEIKDERFYNEKIIERDAMILSLVDELQKQKQVNQTQEQLIKELRKKVMPGEEQVQKSDDVRDVGSEYGDLTSPEKN